MAANVQHQPSNLQCSLFKPFAVMLGQAWHTVDCGNRTVNGRLEAKFGLQYLAMNTSTDEALAAAAETAIARSGRGAARLPALPQQQRLARGMCRNLFISETRLAFARFFQGERVICRRIALYWSLLCIGACSVLEPALYWSLLCIGACSVLEPAALRGWTRTLPRKDRDRRWRRRPSESSAPSHRVSRLSSTLLPARTCLLCRV